VAERGFTVWFTGLSGAGKSTISRLVTDELAARGLVVELLDGDAVRRHLSSELGFSKEHRDLNVHRIGWVASRIVRAGGTVVVAAISPYREARGVARELVEEHGAFVEVHVATSLEDCMERDTKGLYARALAGDVPNFTGVSDPYEEPESPELRVDTHGVEPEASAALVLERLEELGLLAAATAAR
jgi:sulfate adenylyltransferase